MNGISIVNLLFIFLGSFIAAAISGAAGFGEAMIFGTYIKEIKEV